MPRISVVMSIYNGERYLCRSIRSVLNQTFQDFEFIIIDDASTDHSLELVQSFRDNRIRVIRNVNNLGLAASLNKGIKEARGEYIVRQDADDFSYPERFSKQLTNLETHPDTGVLGVTTRWVDEKDKEILIWRQPTANREIQKTLLEYCCLIHGSTMIRKQALIDANGYDPKKRTGQDYDLWLRIAELWDIECLPEILYAHRRHTDMVSLTEKDEQQRHASEALQEAINRRLRYGWILVIGSKSDLPGRLARMERFPVAERFISWSAGAREVNKMVAFRFLLSALLITPENGEAWRYISSIIRRKISKISIVR